MFRRNLESSVQPAAKDSVRLAFPRPVYTQSHIDHLAEVITFVHAQRRQLRGYRMVRQASALRHFAALPEPLPEHRFGLSTLVDITYLSLDAFLIRH